MAWKKRTAPNPAAEEWPQRGGTYLRDPDTGALTLLDDAQALLDDAQALLDDAQAEIDDARTLPD